MRRRWIRSPLPLALLVTLVSIAVGLVILFASGSLDGEPNVDGSLDAAPAEVMVQLLSLATAELFVLWGVFSLVRRFRTTSEDV